MRFARELGLRVPDVEMLKVGGRRVIVVERYDRVVLKNGSVERIHQEDFCQATGVPPEKKYEEDGLRYGESLNSAQSTAAADSLNEFLRAVTLNVIVGNGDAHAKNYSLDELAGTLRLAPVYDVLSTRNLRRQPPRRVRGQHPAH